MAAQQVSHPAVMRLTDSLLKKKKIQQENKSRQYRASTQQIIPESTSMDYSSLEEDFSAQASQVQSVMVAESAPREEIKANISIYRTKNNG